MRRPLKNALMSVCVSAFVVTLAAVCVPDDVFWSSFDSCCGLEGEGMHQLITVTPTVLRLKLHFSFFSHLLASCCFLFIK